MQTTAAPMTAVRIPLKWTEAAEAVLEDEAQTNKCFSGLTNQQLFEAICQRNLVQLVGSTPINSMNARINKDIKDNPHSPFIKPAQGTFALKKYYTPTEPSIKSIAVSNFYQLGGGVQHLPPPQLFPSSTTQQHHHHHDSGHHHGGHAASLSYPSRMFLRTDRKRHTVEISQRLAEAGRTGAHSSLHSSTPAIQTSLANVGAIFTRSSSRSSSRRDSVSSQSSRLSDDGDVTSLMHSHASASTSPVNVSPIEYLYHHHPPVQQQQQQQYELPYHSLASMAIRDQPQLMQQQQQQHLPMSCPPQLFFMPHVPPPSSSSSSNNNSNNLNYYAYQSSFQQSPVASSSTSSSRPTSMSLNSPTLPTIDENKVFAMPPLFSGPKSGSAFVEPPSPTTSASSSSHSIEPYTLPANLRYILNNPSAIEQQTATAGSASASPPGQSSPQIVTVHVTGASKTTSSTTTTTEPMGPQAVYFGQRRNSALDFLALACSLEKAAEPMS